MTTLTDSRVAPLLDDLFAIAEAPATPEIRAAMAEIPADAPPEALYAAAKDVAMAVSRETAQLLYLLARSSRARSIVEFGTSFGISTLHLAAALRDNGGGRLITTEFEPSKATRARAHFAQAGLDDLIELREGDARQSLASGLPEAIDLVLMDGAKPLYPAVLDLLEPRLGPGALLVADDADRSPAYMERVRSPRYVSVPFAGDVEVSMRVSA
jgi:predicted O-methyltransferase YrrM